jgi:hypothetical protein
VGRMGEFVHDFVKFFVISRPFSSPFMYLVDFYSLRLGMCKFCHVFFFQYWELLSSKDLDVEKCSLQSQESLYQIPINPM